MYGEESSSENENADLGGQSGDVEYVAKEFAGKGLEEPGGQFTEVLARTIASERKYNQKRWDYTFSSQFFNINFDWTICDVYGVGGDRLPVFSRDYASIKEDLWKQNDPFHQFPKEIDRYAFSARPNRFRKIVRGKADGSWQVKEYQ